MWSDKQEVLHDLLRILIASENEAADDLLLEALRLGTEAEKNLALNALLRRRTTHGLTGVVAQFNDLPASSQQMIVQNIRHFHHALRECGRSKDPATSLSAMKLIALGRQGKLTYVLAEGLHAPDEAVSKAACEALVALARWVATESRRLQTNNELWTRAQPEFVSAAGESALTEAQMMVRQILDERPEIEQTVARALEVHRGRFGQELMRASLLLADSPLSRTLAILNTPKHGGQSPLIRRLQQAPESEHVDAFLLAASHHGMRSNFGAVLTHIVEPPVLDALLRRTHWLKDPSLQLCTHQVSRGVWWTEGELEKDLARRDAADAARVGEWIGCSGMHDVMQDALLEKIKAQLHDDLAGRLRLLRIAMRRPRGAGVQLLKAFLTDPDERIVRLAAREIVRRRPPEYENILIQVMATCPESVRRVISRSVGQVGFDHFWERFDRMEKSTRKTAGRAMLKVLPDGIQRLQRRLRGGPADQRLKAMQMVQELGATEAVAPILMQLCADPNAKLRSKAVSLLAEVQAIAPDEILDKALHDADARVRSNAIEVLEHKHRTEFIPLLTQRARSTHNRERANAIKAMARMRVGTAASQLLNMLQDERAEHRISAMWALRQIGFWQMLSEVGKIAQVDTNLRARRYALTLLRSVSEMLKSGDKTSAG